MPTLDWLNRADAFTTAAKVPYRLLESISSHGDARSLPRAQDNLLIQGDNLEALKALLPFYRGQVKCIFIDPPYNTKSAFEHYDDNLEHAQWLSMMLPRLQLLRELLREDGSIWLTIDDNEGHYLKVMMDEVFGRGNFVANVVWQKKYAVASDAKGFSDFHDHIFVYTKNGKFHRNLLPRSDKQDSVYNHDDQDGNGPWRTDNLSVKTYSENYNYPLENPRTGKEYWPPKGRCWYTSREKMATLLASNGIYFGKDGLGAPQLKRYLARVQSGVVPSTWWTHEDAGHNDESRKESKVLFELEDPFSTPKPERLLQRILNISTNTNDLILDSFLGSGTKAAVAHKMGRRWIGIEMGDHAATHCLPRLQKVLDGEQGGISKSVNWQGGGGFRFMRLGKPVFDAQGRIHSAVRFATLAAFVWQQETHSAFDPAQAKPGTPYLGTYYVFNSYSSNEYMGVAPISLVNTPPQANDGTIAPSAAVDLFSQPHAAQAAASASTPASTAAQPDAVHTSQASAQPTAQPTSQPTAYYLLYNGILGDKRPASGNVLTHAVLDALLQLHASTAAPQAPLVVYGEACRLGAARLLQANTTFKHIPYDVKAK
jgi:adenine-specific DNA-methyltransferase